MESRKPTKEALMEGVKSAAGDGKAQGGGGGGGGDLVPIQNEDEAVKREISCHPMFGLLKETHLNCLKMCSGDKEEEPSTVLGEVLISDVPQEEDGGLDLFMEAYCTALVELTLAIQKPMQEATAFVDFMYRILDDVSSTDTAAGGATAEAKADE